MTEESPASQLLRKRGNEQTTKEWSLKQLEKQMKHLQAKYKLKNHLHKI